MTLAQAKFGRIAGATLLALSLGTGSALASGVGDTDGGGDGGGYNHNSGGVGIQIGVGDPGLPPLLIGDITLGQEPVEHNPSPNQPSIHYSSQPDPHNPSPVVPGINYDPQNVEHNPSPVVPGVNYDPQGVIHNPSPVVPGINYDPIGVVHNPSPVIPAINYAPSNVVHNPRPVLPGIELGQTSVTHRPNVPLPNLNIQGSDYGINIPIHLPNLNIDIQGLVTNVSGGGGCYRRRCNPCCNGGGDTNIEININRSHEENNFYYRGGNSYTYIENREPTYVEFRREVEVLAHVGWIPLRAVCLDNAGGVHPASQVFPEENVEERYEGEIYRCVIGTSMQYTMGEMVDGARSWDGAWTDTCAAGEALRYADGEIFCAAQEERRPCNERSLLRRFGPGEKVIRLNGMAMTTEATSSMAMDGGVGSYRRY